MCLGAFLFFYRHITVIALTIEMFIVDMVRVMEKLIMKWIVWIVETYILDALLLSVALVCIEELIHYGQ